SPDQMRAFATALHPRRTDLVRIGPADDGGYLLPDVLEGIEACFSPGVGTCSDFELACAERGMQVFLADATVDGPAVDHPAFHFIPKFIGGYDDDTTISLDTWVEACWPGTGDLLLQMDIEGAEYASLLAASPALLRRFRVMVVEFHLLGQLAADPFFAIAASLFAKLLADHDIVHIHPNNFCTIIDVAGVPTPQVMEFTFVRRDHLDDLGWATQFPHPLDIDNDPSRPLALPEVWFHG
ncbi:MAG: FkbM family methyltransferase, partial [Acidobacteria bacterium]|nr:FkbM family methyltransferase [Acidobacteriota bacterium]